MIVVPVLGHTVIALQLYVWIADGAGMGRLEEVFALPMRMNLKTAVELTTEPTKCTKLKKHPRVFCATRRAIAKVDEIRSLSFVFSVFFVVNCFF